MKIAICYSREDYEIVTTIAAHLKTYYHTDEICNYLNVERWALNSEDSLTSRVQRAFPQNKRSYCRVGQDSLTSTVSLSALPLIVILSKTSVQSEWFKSELSLSVHLRGLFKSGIVPLPVIVDNCAPPLLWNNTIYTRWQDDHESARKNIILFLRTFTNGTLAVMPNYYYFDQFLSSQFKLILRQEKCEVIEEQANKEIDRIKKEIEHQDAVNRDLAEAKRNEALHNIRNHFNTHFLGVDAFYQNACAEFVTATEFEQEKHAFVKSWLTNNALGAKSGDKPLPDDEQVAAIAAVNGHIQVVARAGSGKTTTLVNRALFLMKHCGVAPDQILLLAFNRKAALEIRKRLLILLCADAEEAMTMAIHQRKLQAKPGKRIDWDALEMAALEEVMAALHITLPHVMTFHALAYAVVHPEEALLFNAGDNGSQALNRAVQQVIDDHLRSPKFKEDIRTLMLAHFKEDWECIIKGGYDLDLSELLPFRRALVMESLRGESVKSRGEKLIADFLFEHDIPYKYEQNHWWSGINYRPDFTVFINAVRNKPAGIVIEYFGLAGDADYDKMAEDKRRYWENKPDWLLLEFVPGDTAKGNAGVFYALLKERLEALGVPCVRLSNDEIWARIKDRAIDRFTNATSGMIGRCRKLSLSLADLTQLEVKYKPLSPIEAQFLSIFRHLYRAYLDRLRNTGEEDFDGLMQRSALAILNGKTTFERKSGNGNLVTLRYLCIDEFQDFTDLFYRLLTAIRKQNPNVELFCVGDDWQAINGFAGSDLRFFEDFSSYIGKSRRLYISTNYRSVKLIVNVGNALMDGLGKPAVAHKTFAGEVILADVITFKPSLPEIERHSGDSITPAVLRLVSKGLADGLEVVLLSRTNSLPWYVNYKDQNGVNGGAGLDQFLELIRAYFPKDLKERISISTCHKYKGLEKSMVIVLDAVLRRYPMVHPDWVFSRILGDSPEKITNEERRLFYVALTRAAKKLVIMTDGENKSPFLYDIKTNRFFWQAINWQDYPPVAGQSSRMVVKVGNQESRSGGGTFAIKDRLKGAGYQWQSIGWPCWEKSFPAIGFSIEAIKSEIGSELANGIEVRIKNDVDEPIACFLFNDGQWRGR